MIKAVLFDIDGTLIDSVDFHAEAWQRALAKFGIQTDFQSVRRQIGKGGDELMSVFLSEQDLREHGKALEQYRMALFRREYLPRICGFAGVRDLFLRIKQDRKRIALASSAKGEELSTYKSIAEIEGLTDEEASSDDVERSKPHPDIFHAIGAARGGRTAAVPCAKPLIRSNQHRQVSKKGNATQQVYAYCPAAS
jgi:beta-phosphoglucomutase-like phosphatase (HAD superfamily)